jgi:hypothetical protein
MARGWTPVGSLIDLQITWRVTPAKLFPFFSYLESLTWSLLGG